MYADTLVPLATPGPCPNAADDSSAFPLLDVTQDFATTRNQVFLYVVTAI